MGELRRQSEWVRAKPSIRARPAIGARSRERDDPEAAGVYDLLVWVEDGWLSAIEIVEYGDNHKEAVFPSPREFEDPFSNRA